MNYKVHVGSTSALGAQGYSHYLRLGSSGPVWLYDDYLPTWLYHLSIDTKLTCRKLSLFKEPSLGLTEDKSFGSALPWDWKLRMSTPERAILEALEEVPGHESFHNLDMVFEGLATLSPRRFTALLHSCRKIKVKLR